MTILTNRLILRSFRADDLESFASIHADPEVMRYLGGPLSRDQSERELREFMATEAETGLARFALERTSDGDLIGYCGLKPAGEFVDLSYMVAKDHWGRGYASEAAKAVREVGLADLGLTNMEAGGAADNVASIKILGQLDFANRQEVMFNNRPSVRFFD